MPTDTSSWKQALVTLAPLSKIFALICRAHLMEICFLHFVILFEFDAFEVGIAIEYCDWRCGRNSTSNATAPNLCTLCQSSRFVDIGFRQKRKVERSHSTSNVIIDVKYVHLSFKNKILQIWSNYLCSWLYWVGVSDLQRENE